MNAVKQAGKAAGLPHGKDLVMIGEISPIIGIDASALYRAGCRGDLALCRVGSKWAVDLSEVQSWATAYLAQKAAKATIGGKVASALDPFLTTGESPPA